MKVLNTERRVCKIDQADLSENQLFKIDGIDAVFVRTTIPLTKLGWAVCTSGDTHGWKVGDVQMHDNTRIGKNDQVIPVDSVTHEPEYSSCGIEKKYSELSPGDVWEWQDLGQSGFRLKGKLGATDVTNGMFWENGNYHPDLKVIHWPDAVILLDGNEQGGE